MFARFAAITPWKRRVAALFVGLAIGAVITAAYLHHQYAGMRDFAGAYVAAHRAGDVEKLSALFCRDGVPSAEWARLKLTLKQELDLPLKTARFEKIGEGDGASRETPGGRRVPNLKPVFRLALTFGDAQGAGVTVWLVGKSDAGWRIVVYRPE